MNFDVSGEPVHTRCLAIALTQGDPGSVDFRADVLDLRKAGLMELAGRITGAGIIHKMELLGSFDLATGTIERIEWSQSHVAHEANPSTKGECCRDPMGRLEGLVGQRLGEGFASTLKQCFGGPLGCTHVNTLLQELSAAVTWHRRKARTHPELDVPRPRGERIAARSLFFDAFIPKGSPTAEINVRLADLQLATADAQGDESVFSHDEVRLLAEAELATWQLKRVDGGERSRRGPVLEPAEFRARTGDLSDFGGRSLGGGMARVCLERFGAREADACLLSALLSLAPGMTQVGAALSDSLVPSRETRPSSAAPMGAGPCYMLRAGGPLMQRLFPGRDDENDAVS